MKKILKYTILATTFAIAGCTGDFGDSLDFTEVENPNLSEGSVVGVPNSSTIWLDGLERQTANALNEILVLAELGSDNYVNTQTFFNQFLDELFIQATDPDIRDTQRQIQRLRELAVFGLTTVGPADETYNSEIEAEYNFYEGLSYLYSAMYFSYLPQEPNGVPVSANDHYANAIASFEKALALANKAEYHLGKARASYYLGNKSEAVSAANAALAISDNFDRFIRFDQANGPTNVFENALYGRATFDDLQPLPSLDFLDPKYSFLSPQEDPSVHIFKAEEAHLILAEANLSDGNASNAQDNISDLLELIATREVRNFDDSIEGRPEVNPGTRPDKATVVVNGRSGLVLDRQADFVDVPSVSGTSLTAADVGSITADDNGLTLLYRTRQEVFIAEGLRFVDMGVKLIIDENEILLNENIADGDPGTLPVIPSFIEAVIPNLDAFTYDIDAGVANTAIDLNQILVANKSSNQVLPFHN
jgi:tetratricopeptide (TPR) repeat protein